jgi:hypothetical protein
MTTGKINIYRALISIASAQHADVGMTTALALQAMRENFNG